MARSKAAIEEDFIAKLSASEQMITSLKQKLACHSQEGKSAQRS
jgi:hypothetical protein